MALLVSGDWDEGETAVSPPSQSSAKVGNGPVSAFKSTVCDTNELDSFSRVVVAL